MKKEGLRSAYYGDMRSCILFGFLISLVFFAKGTACPESSFKDGAQLQKALEYRISVALKLVQVYVADRKGNPVPDLDKDNFVLIDNGKFQKITEFEKHFLSLSSSKETPEILATQNAPVPSPAESMSRKFFLFFDFAYSTPKGVLKAREAALHFLNTKLQLSDEVGVISYSALKGMKIHEFLTTEHKKVREVVEHIGLREAAGRAEDLDARYHVNVKYFSYPCGKDISQGHGKDISHPHGKQISQPSSE